MADSRQRLLGAAERLFAEHGYAAASVRDITRTAGCNIASVNYHFGDKRKLYREVFRHRLANLREQRIASVERAMLGSGPAALERMLSDFASAYLQPLLAKSDGRILMELISREMLNPHLPTRVFQEQVVEPVQEALSGALVAAVPGLSLTKARLCVLSLVGQLIHVVHRYQYDRAARRRPSPSLQAMVDHIVQFSAAGIRVRAHEARISGRIRR